MVRFSLHATEPDLPDVLLARLFFQPSAGSTLPRTLPDRSAGYFVPFLPSTACAIMN